MSNSILHFLYSILIGIGATLTFDLWALFIKHAFKIAPSNFCLVGRWILCMPKGIFRHRNINTAPMKNTECTIGRITHYLTGISFSTVFLAFVGNRWFEHPTLIPALTFGVVTVLAPFCIMQPAFGLGFAASKTQNPTQARLRTLVNHISFGIGLYLFGWLLLWIL